MERRPDHFIWRRKRDALHRSAPMMADIRKGIGYYEQLKPSCELAQRSLTYLVFCVPPQLNWPFARHAECVICYHAGDEMLEVDATSSSDDGTDQWWKKRGNKKKRDSTAVIHFRLTHSCWKADLIEERRWLNRN